MGMKKILIFLLAIIAMALPTTAQNAVYVTMKVTPVNATVTIDGQKQTLSPKGELIVRLPSGEHRYEEAVRVVKSLPRFIPGKQQGKAVRVWLSLPVRFQLQ